MAARPTPRVGRREGSSAQAASSTPAGARLLQGSTAKDFPRRVLDVHCRPITVKHQVTGEFLYRYIGLLPPPSALALPRLLAPYAHSARDSWSLLQSGSTATSRSPRESSSTEAARWSASRCAGVTEGVRVTKAGMASSGD